MPSLSNFYTTFYTIAKNSLNVAQNVTFCAVKDVRPDHLGDGILGAALNLTQYKTGLEKKLV